MDDDTGYDYEVAAVSNDGYNANPASAVSATTPLLAPTDLMATTNGPTEIDLSWSNNSQATAGYTIERSTDGSTWTTAGTVANADSTYYSDTALALATRYYYRVMATDSASTASPASNIASAVTGPTFEVSEGSSGSLESAVVVDTDASCAACEVDPIISEDVDWGDGSSSTESGDPDSMSHYFSNPGSYTVTVIANTADGPVDSSSTTADVTVAVPEPTLEFSSSTMTVGQGAGFALHPEYCSDGAEAESEYLLDWGDGTPYQSYSDSTTEFDHCYAHGGSDYHVEAFLETSVGVVGAGADITVTGSNPIDDPGTYSTGFSLSDVTTDSALPATTGDTVQAFVTATMHDYSCSCGGGDDPESECGTVDFGNSSSGGFYFSNASGSEPCEAIDNSYHEDGQYLITMTATDGSDETKFATVDNAVPVMSTIPEQVTGSGESFSVSDSYSNMSTELSPVAFINWGDGTGPHVATVSPSGASGTITASTSSAPAPGVYTATLTLYPMGPTGTSGGPTYAVTKTFTLYSWGVVIDHGESNDLLIASSDGTQNQQNVTLIMPHPAGEAFTVYLSGSDVSQNDLFNSSGTKLTPSGSDYPAVEIASGDSASSITYEDGAIDGNSTADVNQYTLNSEYDASDSTSAFQSQAAAGCGTVPAAAPTSKPASQVGVQIHSLTAPNGDNGNSGDVTGVDRQWIVGQDVFLTAHIVGPAAASTALSYTWGVPGNTLYNYADSTSSAKAVSLERVNSPGSIFGLPSGTRESSVYFFWVNTHNADGSPDLNTVTLSVRNGGKPIGSASTQFTVHTANIDGTSDSSGTTQDYLDDDGFPRLGLTHVNVGASVSMPTGFAGSGEWKFVQLLTQHFIEVKSFGGNLFIGTEPTNNQTVLDTFDPYEAVDGKWSDSQIFPTGTDHTLEDAPSFPLVPELVALYNSYNFEDYVMFRPPGGSWVPLASVTWHWQVAFVTVLGRSSFVGSGPDVSAPSFQSNEPTWTTFITGESLGANEKYLEI